MAMLKALYPQWFPEKPAFTEKDMLSQVERVFIVTGSNIGLGFELFKMLYLTSATIYMAGRLEERINSAIEEITSVSPTPATPAMLENLHYDLADLPSVRKAAAKFVDQEGRFDILWHNAGIGGVKGLTTEQNIEGHVGINCVAPLLFTEPVSPQIKASARSNGKARIIWTRSALTKSKAPTGGNRLQAHGEEQVD